MDFDEAKFELEKEERERERKWHAERLCNIAQGTANEIDLLIEKKHPWYETAYWTCWRILKDFFKGYTFRKVGSRVQRARRGYGVQDTWGLDNYLSSWMPQALRDLKNRGIGCPMRVYNHDGTICYELSPTNDSETETFELWKDILERMAQGFEAHAFLADYGWFQDTLAEKELARIEHEGLQLFVYNFSSLWD